MGEWVSSDPALSDGYCPLVSGESCVAPYISFTKIQVQNHMSYIRNFEKNNKI